MGIEASVSERIAAVAQGQYRRMVDTDERFARHIGLDGFSARVGLQGVLLRANILKAASTAGEIGDQA